MIQVTASESLSEQALTLINTHASVARTASTMGKKQRDCTFAKLAVAVL
jgi:hypothetical protein